MAERARIAQLRELMSRVGADAFLISQPESRRYLSGFTGHDHPPMDSAGYLFITQADAILLTDSRTTEQAEREAPYYEVRRIDSRLAAALAQFVPAMGLSRIAFEGNHLPYRFHEEVKGAIGDGTLMPTYDLVDRIRAVKGPAELEAIREAVAMADATFAHLLTMVTPGITEKELAWEVETFLRKSGSEGMAFDPIVASGPNASMPHHVPGDRPLQTGEPIIIDWGAKVRGYCSDITRTIVLGEPTEKLKEVYDVVLQAQLKAEARIKAGIAGSKADGIARKVIESAGYGEAFGHGLGHGVGLAIHESPRLGRASQDVLEDGMVFSIEPGIYLPGWGGVRIEDLATLRGGKLIVLTRSPKQFEAMEV
ncbi:MAG TPA: aminopeptidase P family protein [Chloroflexota bacterium]